MADTRIVKLAQVLVHYSIPVKADDWFVVSGSDLAAPLIREVFREALQVGAHVETRVRIEGLDELFYKHASDEQLSHIGESDWLFMRKVNSTLQIMSPHNLKSLSAIDPARQSLAGKARAELSKVFMERAGSGDLRWCLTLLPTQAGAQEAGMSLSDYESFVYGAMLLDRDDPVEAWKAQGRAQQRMADFLSEVRELRFVAADTDLRLAVAGRKWLNDDGQKNFPGGEVFSAPLEDSVSGTVAYNFPAIMGGREIDGIRLTFERGRVVHAEARTGGDYLNEMLNMDEGARTLGEIGIGTNMGIQRFTKNMLFDEKIGGTAHFALGAAYPETGGLNVSSLHWDMLLDLRSGGEVFADGMLVMKDGKWNI